MQKLECAAARRAVVEELRVVAAEEPDQERAPPISFLSDTVLVPRERERGQNKGKKKPRVAENKTHERDRCRSSLLSCCTTEGEQMNCFNFWRPSRPDTPPRLGSSLLSRVVLTLQHRHRTPVCRTGINCAPASPLPPQLGGGLDDDEAAPPTSTAGPGPGQGPRERSPGRVRQKHGPKTPPSHPPGPSAHGSGAPRQQRCRHAALVTSHFLHLGGQEVGQGRPPRQPPSSSSDIVDCTI